MKHHFCARSAVLKGDVQHLGRLEFYSNILKSDAQQAPTKRFESRADIMMMMMR